MFVGKQFDIVLGVDIHIIQPPGPVPPVPIPHPFVGMVYDPMEFVPILGASNLVNGIPRAQAGTTVKATPPHFPIGGTFIKPPSNDGEIFMGSMSVPVEGEPFPFLGCPVMTCQDAGMLPIPRRRKSKSKPKSMVLPMSVLLPVPKGGMSFSPTPPIVSLTGVAMVAVGGVLKKVKKRKKKYKTFHEFKLDKKDWKKSDRLQFKKANESLFKKMKKDKKFRKKMERTYPGTWKHVQPGPRGIHKRTSPPNLTWHHHPTKKGSLELVDRQSHNAKHSVYHPDGVGGRKTWGGGEEHR